MFFDQVCRPFEILTAQRMLYGLIDEAVILVPLTGPNMQRRDPIRLFLAQALA